MSYIGAKPTIGNFQICDAISVVNGQAAYTMQVGSTNVIPQSANHMIVSLNGVIQKPNSSYTVSGATITFSSNLATGDVINFIQILGDVLDLGVPSDATVTNAKTNFVSTSSAAGLQIKGDGTTDGTLQLNCSQNSHGIKLKSPAHSASASYTLTFPTTDGNADQFLQSNGSGVLTWAEAGGGKINQVVQTVNSTISQMSSSSFADVSGMSVAITPSASNSKILITVSLYAGQNGNSVAFFKLLRGSTVIGSGADAGNRVGCNFSFGVDGGDGHSQVHSNSYSYLDSPSTTNATTYKIQGASYNNATLTFNRTPNDADHVTSARCTSVITAMEVLA